MVSDWLAGWLNFKPARRAGRKSNTQSTTLHDEVRLAAEACIHLSAALLGDWPEVKAVRRQAQPKETPFLDAGRSGGRAFGQPEEPAPRLSQRRVRRKHKLQDFKTY